MILGVEIDFVVEDSIVALELYEKIFEVERLEVTSFEKGRNEAVFTIYDSRFHMLDENLDFELIAPKPGDPKPIWFNIAVGDIMDVHNKAMSAGCAEIQPVTEIVEMGISNSMFSDPFGYMWMLHQIHREISFEERMKLF